MILYSIGNKKVSKDTLIFNMTSATNCPSRALGLCNIGKKCYAMKAERLYKAVLPYRERQAEYWNSHTAEQIEGDLVKALEKHPEVFFIRFSEAGDFKTQEDVDKMVEIAWCLKQDLPEVIMYGYTARKDLCFVDRPSNLVIQGTYFKIDNMFIPTVPKVYDKLTKVVKCKGACEGCLLCKTSTGEKIYVRQH